MRPGWKDKPNGPSVFAIQVMATKGPLLLVEVLPWTATVKDGHAENGRANKPPVTPMSQDFLLSLLRPFFTFISFSSPLLSPSLSPRGRDVVKFRTTRICWGGREGHENSSMILESLLRAENSRFGYLYPWNVVFLIPLCIYIFYIPL